MYIQLRIMRTFCVARQAAIVEWVQQRWSTSMSGHILLESSWNENETLNEIENQMSNLNIAAKWPCITLNGFLILSYNGDQAYYVTLLSSCVNNKMNWEIKMTYPTLMPSKYITRNIVKTSISGYEVTTPSKHWVSVSGRQQLHQWMYYTQCGS